MIISTVTYVFHGPADLEHLCEIYAKTPLDKVKIAINNYASIRFSTYKNYEYIDIGHILYDDIIINNAISTYDSLCNKYGQELLDIIVTKDDELVIQNIINSINFMFDDIFKSNCIKVVFYNEAGTANEKTKFNNLIYSALQRNFIIKSQISNGINFIIIEKKENINNVNNAD